MEDRNEGEDEPSDRDVGGAEEHLQRSSQLCQLRDLEDFQ